MQFADGSHESFQVTRDCGAHSPLLQTLECCTFPSPRCQDLLASAVTLPAFSGLPEDGTSISPHRPPHRASVPSESSSQGSGAPPFSYAIFAGSKGGALEISKCIC